MDTGLLTFGCQRLDSEQVMRLTGAPGRRLAVARGTVWVTQEGDARDWVVAVGECVAFERTGAVVIQALGGEAAVVLEEGIAVETMRARTHRVGRAQSVPDALDGHPAIRSESPASVGVLARSWRALMRVVGELVRIEPGERVPAPMIDAIGRRRTGAGGPY